MNLGTGGTPSYKLCSYSQNSNSKSTMIYRSIQQFYCNGVVVQRTICDNVKFGFESTEIRMNVFFSFFSNGFIAMIIPVFQVGWIYEMLCSVIKKKQMIFCCFQCNYAKRLPGRWAGSLVLYLHSYTCMYIYIYWWMYVCYLVGGLEHCLFVHILGIMIPTD